MDGWDKVSASFAEPVIFWEHILYNSSTGMTIVHGAGGILRTVVQACDFSKLWFSKCMVSIDLFCKIFGRMKRQWWKRESRLTSASQADINGTKACLEASKLSLVNMGYSADVRIIKFIVSDFQATASST